MKAREGSFLSQGQPILDGSSATAPYLPRTCYSAFTGRTGVGLSFFDSTAHARYTVPRVSGPVLWRYSVVDSTWRAQDIQGIDYSSMLLGLAAYFLGNDFFTENNDYAKLVRP